MTMVIFFKKNEIIVHPRDLSCKNDTHTHTRTDMFLPLSCERLEQDKTTTSSAPSSASHTAGAVESPPPPSQPPAASTESHQDTGNTAPPTQPVCEEPTPPNNPPGPSYRLYCGKDGRDLLKATRCLERSVSSAHVSLALVSGPDHSVTSAAQGQEGDYDVLPIRKSLTFTIDPTFPLRCMMMVRFFSKTPLNV